MPITTSDSQVPVSQRCDTCGVRMRQERLTLTYMSHRLREDVFGAERGLFVTIWHLLVKPRQVTSGFIRGDNLRYYSPLKYFVVMLALSLVLPNDSILDDFIIGVIDSLKTVSEETASNFVHDWSALVYLPLVAILALINRFFYREKNYNLAEHLVIAVYGWAQMVLLGAVAFTVSHFIAWLGYKTGIFMVLFFAPYVYWFWYCHAVFAQRNLSGWLRAFAGLPFALVVYFLMMAFGFSTVYALMRMNS